MANPQDQYADALRSGQEAVAGALESWQRATQQMFSTLPSSPFPPVDPGQIIDQVFDFAEKMLETQREFAKSLANASVQVGDTLRQQAEGTVDQATSTARKAADTASSSARKTK